MVIYRLCLWPSDKPAKRLEKRYCQSLLKKNKSISESPTRLKLFSFSTTFCWKSANILCNSSTGPGSKRYSHFFFYIWFTFQLATMQTSWSKVYSIKWRTAFTVQYHLSLRTARSNWGVDSVYKTARSIIRHRLIWFKMKVKYRSDDSRNDFVTAFMLNQSIYKSQVC